MQSPGERLRSCLAEAQLYLCTDARRERGDLADFADAALAGGVDIVQLRDKGSAGEQQFGPLEARHELGALVQSGRISADAWDEYLLCISDPAAIHAMFACLVTSSSSVTASDGH